MSSVAGAEGIKKMGYWVWLEEPGQATQGFEDHIKKFCLYP